MTAAMIKRAGGSMLAVVAVLAIGGCAVGPDFQKPAAPDVASVAAGPLPDSTASADVVGGQPQHFVSGGDIPTQWWTLFHSAELDELNEQGTAHTHELKAEQAPQARRK